MELEELSHAERDEVQMAWLRRWLGKRRRERFLKARRVGTPVGGRVHHEPARRRRTPVALACLPERF